MSAAEPARRLSLHTKVFIGLAVGIGAGLWANLALGGGDPRVVWVISHVTEPVGTLFLRLLLMTVIPLVFSTLIVGIAGLGDVRKLGRIGVRTLTYCAIISAISVFVGIALVNTVKPGKRLPPDKAAELQARYAAAAEAEVQAAKAGQKPDSPFMRLVKTIVPSNPIAAIAGENPNMLHLMFFTVVLGIAVTLAGRERTGGFVSALEGLAAVSAKIIDLIMQAAPYAVACLLFNNVARFGHDLLTSLLWFIVVVLVGLSFHLFVVYSISVRLLSRISPLEFFRRIETVLVTAFSTSSSVATLPTTLRVSEENLRVPPDINSFVLTVGATANQNGTALYEGVTVLFLAQLAGVDLTLGQQAMVAGLAILGGIGTAGVPSASIPFIIVVLAGIGVNPALIAIILGVERILDMCRTVVNVVGDMTAATYVARSEGHELFTGK